MKEKLTIREEFFTEFKELFKKYIETDDNVELYTDDMALICFAAVPTSTGSPLIFSQISEVDDSTSQEQMELIERILIRAMDSLVEMEPHNTIMKLGMLTSMAQDTTIDLGRFHTLRNSRSIEEENEIKNLLNNGNEDNIYKGTPE